METNKFLATLDACSMIHEFILMVYDDHKDSNVPRFKHNRVGLGKLIRAFSHLQSDLPK